MVVKIVSDLFYFDMGCYGKFLMKDEMSLLEIDIDKVVKYFFLIFFVLYVFF